MDFLGAIASLHFARYIFPYEIWNIARVRRRMGAHSFNIIVYYSLLYMGGSIGIMEKDMETTRIRGVRSVVFRCFVFLGSVIPGCL